MAMTEPTNPTIVVTGASGGVGRGIALSCADAGWTVWIAARRAEQGREVAEQVSRRGGHGHFVACDVTSDTSVAEAIESISSRSGRLDGVVHNSTSGLSPKPTTLAEVPVDELEDHLAVSVRGTYLMAKASFPMLKAKSGSMLLLTSEAGFEGKARLAPYAAVKAAQRGLARTLAREWGPAGVRVNCVAPLAATPAMEEAFERDASMASRVLGRLPLGYLGDPAEDIGPVARFLLSSDARYVTGQTIMVDGGSCPIS